MPKSVTLLKQNILFNLNNVFYSLAIDIYTEYLGLSVIKKNYNHDITFLQEQISMEGQAC